MQQLEGLKAKPDFFSPQVRLLSTIQIRPPLPSHPPHPSRPPRPAQRASRRVANAPAVTCIFFADVLEGENRHASNRRSPGRYFRLVSAFSIAEVRSFESGSTFESNRAITFPSGPIKNFV